MKKRVQSKATVDRLIRLTKNDLQASLVRVCFLSELFNNREEGNELIKARVALNEALESITNIQKIRD